MTINHEGAVIRRASTSRLFSHHNTDTAPSGQPNYPPAHEQNVQWLRHAVRIHRIRVCLPHGVSLCPCASRTMLSSATARPPLSSVATAPSTGCACPALTLALASLLCWAPPNTDAG